VTSLRRAVAAMLLGPSLGGCSFGLFQTAHTQPPGTVAGRLGATEVLNAIDEEAGRDVSTNTTAEVGVRVGLAQRVDIGLGSFFLSGARADVKVNVLDPKAALAIAPRFGLGAQYKYDVLMVEGGAIVSYRLFGVLEPYGGLTFANHWIGGYPASVDPSPDLARRTGEGNGLLQAALGFAVDTKQGFGLMAEYGHWFVMNNDPGDNYAFLPTNIVGVAIRFGAVQSH